MINDVCIKTEGRKNKRCGKFIKKLATNQIQNISWNEHGQNIDANVCGKKSKRNAKILFLLDAHIKDKDMRIEIRN